LLNNAALDSVILEPMNKSQLEQKALDVLKTNDLGGWTRPTAGLYPHQWLWDSCFISIGLSHVDTKRAQEEIRSLLKAQWKNGMIPHIIFSEAKGYHAGPALWKAHVSKNCPDEVSSTGISQPPLLAEAIVRIGNRLPPKERQEWYREVFPDIARFHEWLYRDRDPETTGLVTIVHPWESGLDNTPPWMEMLHNYAISKKLWVLEKSEKATRFIERFRKDTSVVPAEERMSTLDLFAIYELIKQLRGHKYDDKKILKKQNLLLIDLVFNSILIRANDLLAEIADEIDQPLPPLVERAHQRGISVLDTLWDSTSGQYYSADRSREPIKVPTIATFLPLYAGKLPPERVKQLLEHLHDPQAFQADYGVPTTPLNSPYFKPHCYWQGPVWINMNWLIIDGLEHNGLHSEAKKLREKTLQLVNEHGMNEYFSPLDGSPAGSKDFSWTAALTLDLLKQ
jgi:glycogen debranching enzyme